MRRITFIYKLDFPADNDRKPSDGIVWLYRVTASCDLIMWLHRVIATYACIAGLHHVTASCDCIVWLHRVTSSCDCIVWLHRYITTVMEFLLVCTNIRTTDFNLSCELLLDSFCDFQNGPAFPRQCVRNSTGFCIQKGSSSNYVAPSTSVCTTVHRSTWLNYAYRSPHSRDVVICDRLHMIRQPLRTGDVY